MPVLVMPAIPLPQRSSSLATAVARWQLKRTVHAQWEIVARRVDPHLLADAGIADIDGLERDEYGGGDRAIRSLHWML